MEELYAQAIGLAGQVAAPASPNGGISADGWKVISFLCAAIGAMFLWIKAKDKKIDDLQDARIADLKENAALLRDDDDNGKSG